jgi:DNA repair protein RecO (recombination protein O)
MIETATGVILRCRPITETSLIVHWLTPGLGRVATVAKGARRPNSSFRGKLDLFYEADFSFARSRRSELHTLREVLLRETHTFLRRELGQLQQAAYCAALIEQTTETETPLPSIFDLMNLFLHHISAQPMQPNAVLAFEFKLLSELGLHPDLEQSKMSPGARQIGNQLGTAEWPVLGRIRITRPQLAELRRFLQAFLIYHLGKTPRGREAAFNALDSKQPNLPNQVSRDC